MGHFKFKKNREPLTDQEINQQMNFNKFISGHTPPVKGWFKGLKLLTTAATTSAVIIASVYLIYHSGKTEKIILNPFINPPIAAMDVQPDSFTMDAGQDSTLIYKTGTMIKIPTASFVDENGKDVKGPVEIRYREFHDPIDILLGGIPMDYDSAGTHYQLESAGMFEVAAFQNGKPLKLKPGKQLTVNMISPTNNPNDYNIYGLDTTAKEWKYISENTTKNKTCFPLFERNPGITVQLQKPGTENKPIAPLKEDLNALNFIIDFKKDEFPELAAYTGLKFQPIEGDHAMHQSLAEKTWEDVLIQKQDGDNFYTVTFSTDKESHRLKVIPVVNKENYASAMEDFHKQQLEYERILAVKKAKYSANRDSLYHLKMVFANEAMNHNMNERFNNFIDGSYSETNKDLLAYRTFSISRLGFCNSDKPYDFFALSPIYSSTRGKYKATFVNKEQAPLELRQVILIRRNVNSICGIPADKYDRFPFGKGWVDVMVGITYENKLVYLQDDELNQAKVNNNIIRFEMNETGDDIKTPQQLKALLKI